MRDPFVRKNPLGFPKGRNHVKKLKSVYVFAIGLEHDFEVPVFRAEFVDERFFFQWVAHFDAIGQLVQTAHIRGLGLEQLVERDEVIERRIEFGEVIEILRNGDS